VNNKVDLEYAAQELNRKVKDIRHLVFTERGVGVELKNGESRTIPLENWNPGSTSINDMPQDTRVILLAHNGKYKFTIWRDDSIGKDDVVSNNKRLKNFDKYLQNATYIYVGENTINNRKKAKTWLNT
jgi:hypothetical protein